MKFIQAYLTTYGVQAYFIFSNPLFLSLPIIRFNVLLLTTILMYDGVVYIILFLYNSNSLKCKYNQAFIYICNTSAYNVENL
jgi:hypothetical protein